MSGGVSEFNKSINLDFSTICEPILELLDLTHFIYINLVEQNKRLYLCNDPQWVDFYIQHRLHEDPKHEKCAIKPKKDLDHAFWGGRGSDLVFDAARSQNLANGFIMYQGSEIFSFATKPEKTAVSGSYLENLDRIRLFINTFKVKTEKLITVHKNAGNVLVNSLSIVAEKTTSDLTLKEKDFMEKIKISRFIFESKNKHACLTLKELQTIVYASSGKTLKEIAFLMGLAERTVETHLDNVKNKLECNLKSRIIELFHNSNLKWLTIDKINLLEANNGQSK